MSFSQTDISVFFRLWSSVHLWASAVSVCATAEQQQKVHWPFRAGQSTRPGHRTAAGCPGVFQTFLVFIGGHAVNAEEPQPAECHPAAVLWTVLLRYCVRPLSTQSWHKLVLTWDSVTCQSRTSEPPENVTIWISLTVCNCNQRPKWAEFYNLWPSHKDCYVLSRAVPSVILF